MIHTEAEELDMMSRPDKWPHSFVLPLIRARDPRYGVLYQPSCADPVPPPRPVVYLGLMADTGAIGNRERVEYVNLEAIVADGWRVD